MSHISIALLFPTCLGLLEIRGEVYLSRKTFMELNEARTAANASTFSNPRNAASGSLRQLNSDETRDRQLGFFAYGIEKEGDIGGSMRLDSQAKILKQLESWGFETAHPWESYSNLEDLLAFHQRLEANRAYLPFDIDGVVYKLDSLALRSIAGRSARAPRWAIAHKFSPDEAQTLVNAIEVQVRRERTRLPAIAGEE